MPHERDHIDFDIGPPPPTVVALAYLVVTGVVHLVLAALFDCLQQLHLVLGLLDLAVALVVTLLLLRRRKRQQAWYQALLARIGPEPSDHHH